jgi:N-methylhydantoinase B/oxoprolinase/acetone carboxylase alpha subunit
MSTFNNLYRCLSRSFFARGFREEILAGYGNNTMCQLGGTDQYGRPLGIINFELSSVGCGARAVWDGLDTGYAVWNPEADQGNIEIWEMFIPKVYLGRNLTPDSAGMGKYRGGSGFHCVYLFWGSENIEVVSAGPGKVFDNCGIYGGYPGARVMRHKEMVLDSNIREVVAEFGPYPTKEGDPNSPILMEYLEGDKRVVDRSMMHPVPMKTGDVFIQHYQGGPGYGDPIERDPDMVVHDMNNNTVIERKAREVYGVSVFFDETEKTWKHDPTETEQLRDGIRKKRKERGVPMAHFLKTEKERILKKDFLDVIVRMYRESMELSPEFATEYREFWDLPEDFVY